MTIMYYTVTYSHFFLSLFCTPTILNLNRKIRSYYAIFWFLYCVLVFLMSINVEIYQCWLNRFYTHLCDGRVLMLYIVMNCEPTKHQIIVHTPVSRYSNLYHWCYPCCCWCYICSNMVVKEYFYQPIFVH